MCCYHGPFAYVAVELTGRHLLPLMRLRYSGSAHCWSLAHLPGQRQQLRRPVLIQGAAEESLVFVCNVLVSPITE
jgi:hypothetical protein